MAKGIIKGSPEEVGDMALDSKDVQWSLPPFELGLIIYLERLGIFVSTTLFP